MIITARTNGAPSLFRTHEFRIALIGSLMLLAFVLLAGKLWYLQMARGVHYADRMRATSQIRVRLPAVRGEILDRTGLPLAQNRASVAVEFYLPDIVREYRRRFGDVPMHNYRVVAAGAQKEKSEPDIVRIVNETIMPKLAELGLTRDYNANQLRLHYRSSSEIPFLYLEDLDFDTMAKFTEHDLALPGIDVSVRPVRHYTYGSLGAHFLGYVGEPEEVDAKEAEQFDFYQQEAEGKTQLESLFDDELRGTAGARVLQRNAKGVIEREVAVEPPIPGCNIELTIDARIQFIAEKALRAVGRGAAIVVDVHSGDILAMASVPSFDPNSFIPAIASEDWKQLATDATHPLLNRATSAYAPGSTYKVVPALAGFRKNIGDKSFTCNGGVQYGTHMLKCSGSHGTIDVGSALRVSCNAFFCLYGNAAGIDAIDDTGRLLGLGQKTGLPLSGEYAGILPGPEWLENQKLKEQWSTGQTANTSIGQGFVLATPLQMAMVAATLANGGTSYYPRLVRRVVARDGRVIREEPVKIRANLLENGFTPEGIEAVRRGMWDVVNRGGGTAPGARIKNYEVAGKTGTAQFWRRGAKDNHTWFITFAPYHNPRYAVCVMVNGGSSGGGVAAPIASKILSDIFKMEEGNEVQLASLAPAKGSFGYVSSVDFGRAIPAALAAAPPGEPGEPGGTASAPQPKVKPAADSEGSVTKKPNFFQRLFGRKKKNSAEG
ncbi:MAG: penicillin-binding protein 2 [Chthoniobacterales bacterium]|nr:penicillin-binding protein 2 [Chthoniobacterales bacterium]